MRSSAEIGSEKITRSTRVRRAEFDQIVDGAELALAGAVGAAALVAAVVEQADDLDAGILLPPQLLDHVLAGLAAADDHGAAGEAAFARPFAHQQEQQLARGDQRDQAADIEAAEPDAREHLAGFGEERRADHDQEHHRPGRGEPHVLLLVAAEGLHLVDVGGLEGEHRQQRDGEDRDDVAPEQVFARRQIGGKDRQADQHDQRELGHAHEAGEHDRRDRRRRRRRGDRERFRRQRMGFGAARGAARRRSRTAAALDALIDGRVSVSVMADANISRPRAAGRGGRDCP